MTPLERVRALWADMNARNWDALPAHFAPDAVILWPNTGERFTLEAFQAVNAAYPGRWNIAVERLVETPSLVVFVVRVQDEEGDVSFHAVSFFEFDGDRIEALTEYWGQDGAPPEWRMPKG